MSDVLPDVLCQGLSVVFVGSAVGTRSAQVRAYYAGRGNLFWRMLFEAKLTDRLLAPEEYKLLPRYGLGLTDLAKHESGADAGLTRNAYNAAGLAARLRAVGPRLVAFNGRTPWRHFMASGHAAGFEVVVLPSTSGAARRWWDPEPWHALAAKLRSA